MVLLPTRARRRPARPSWWPTLRRDLPQPPGQPPAPHARWLWPAAGGHAGGRRDGVCAQWVAPPSPQPGRRALHTRGLRPMDQGHGPRGCPGCPAALLACSTFPNVSCRVGRLSLWESLGMGWSRPWARLVLHVAMLVPAHSTADSPQPLCLRTCYFLG